MDLKKVYVIFAGGFTKESVMKELEDDNFNFYFGNGQDYAEQVEQLQITNEVWVFGNCKMMRDYKYAKEIGKEIWIMG